ncbi:MAG: flagellar biosynthetic protein FliR [Phycisphaerae bacterium]|nr:MAG: flagellar biosynthetic protein FliR [Phycisphaerae bacterium]
MRRLMRREAMFSAASILMFLPALALVMGRLGGLVVAAPLLGSRAIPVKIKAAFVMTAALVVLPMVMPTVPAEVTVAEALTGMAGEILIGWSIGLILTIVATGVEYAANLMGQQAGLSLAPVFDPTLNQETSELGQIYSMVFFLVFLGVGGHREMVMCLLETFARIPVLTFGMEASFGEALAEVLTGAMTFGVRLASPLLISSVLMSVVMGFLSRTMPQMNVLTIGFNLKVLMLLGICGLTLGFCDELILDAISAGFDAVRGALAGG